MATEIKLPPHEAAHSLAEAARCLGVAQAKGDEPAIAHWNAEVDALVKAVELNRAAEPTIGTPEGFKVYAKGYAAGKKKGRAEAVEELNRAAEAEGEIKRLVDETIDYLSGPVTDDDCVAAVSLVREIARLAAPQPANCIIGGVCDGGCGDECPTAAPQPTAAAVPEELRKVVEAHCADLNRCVPQLREAGMPTLADEVALAAKELTDALAAAPQPAPQCRTDGRCQHAIDHGAEGLAACPTGKCCMPAPQGVQPEVDERKEFNKAWSLRDDVYPESMKPQAWLGWCWRAALGRIASKKGGAA